MSDIVQESTLAPPDHVGWQASPSGLKLDYLHRYASGQTALDLGCGRGWYASALADMDLAVTAIDQTNRVDDPRITVLEQPIAVPLPFPDGAFDTVLMFDILEHLPDEAGVLGEVARVCRRRLILSVPHADDGFLPRYGLTYLHHTDKTHLRLYTPDGLRALLDGYGFETLRVALEGGATIPLAFAEFVWGGALVRQLARYTITALYKIGLIQNKGIAGDIFYVGERRGQE
ncbi:MAG: class I SAM-dependent methyltransferase [Chloroflexota bacterium]